METDEVADTVRESQRLRALAAELTERVRQLTKLLDDYLGTPCEQIRHAEEKAVLLSALESIWHAPEGPNLAGSIQAMRDKARCAVAKAKEWDMTQQTAGKDGTTRRLMDENIALRTLNADLVAAKFSRITELESELAKFVSYNNEVWALNEELVAALQWYADISNYKDWQDSNAQYDRGERARAVLAKTKGEKDESVAIP